MTALVGFAREVADVAGSLEDLSQKTGISGQALSALKPIAEQSSSSIQDFATGMTRLIRSLADSGAAGDKARRTLSDIGISARQLRDFTAEPEKFIATFAEKLAAIDNPAKRAAVAFDVMGRQGANLIPTFLRIAELTKELGGFDKIKVGGIDDATIRSLKQFGDALISIRNTLVNIAALPLSEIAKFFRAITGSQSSEDRLNSLNLQIEALQRSASNQIARLPKAQREILNSPNPDISRLPPGLQNTFAQTAALTKQRDAIQGVVDALNKPFKPIEPVSDESIKKLASFREELQKVLDQLRTERVGLLFGPQAAEATKLDETFARFKQSLADARIPIPAGAEAAFQNLKKQILDAKDANEVLKLSLEQSFSALDDLDKEFGKDLDLANSKTQDVGKITQKLADDIDIAVEKAKLLGPAFDLSAAKAQATENAISSLAGIKNEPLARQRGADLSQQLPGQRTTAIIDELARSDEEARKLAQALGGYYDLVGAEISDTQRAIEELIKNGLDPADARIQRLQDRIGDLRAVEELQKGLEGLGDVLAQVLTGQIRSWQDFGKAVQKVIGDIASEWLRAQAKAFINQQIGGATGIAGGNINLGGAVSSVGNFFSSAGSAIAKFFGFHEGGLVTADGGHASFSRELPAALIYSAPRYHSGGIAGLRPGELPAILQKDEIVLPSGTKIGGSGGSGGMTFHIYQPNFPDRRSQGQVMAKIASSVKIAQQRNS